MSPTTSNPASPSEPPPPGRRAPGDDIGDDSRPDERPGLRLAWLEGGALRTASGDEALAQLERSPGPVGDPSWVDLVEPPTELVQRVGAALAVHPLVIEDVIEGNQRAKVEQTSDHVQIVLFHLEFGGQTVASEVDIVLGPGFLLTVHSALWDPRASHHLKGDGLREVLKHGPDHLLWAICDDIVDSYFPFADQLADVLDSIQDDVVRDARPHSLERLFSVKRELIAVRRAISPVREVFNQLTNRDNPLVDADEIIYFRDVYDHVIRLTDEMDNYRELASATLDVYLSQVNNNLSVVMKRLTAVTGILAGIGAVAGIFGMSEAGTALAGREASGFWMVTALLVVAGAIAAVILRAIDWI
jgi:magnesium transporter